MILLTATQGTMMQSNLELIKEIKEKIKSVKDFPANGIIFRDLTPILNSPTTFSKTINALFETVKTLSFDIIVSPEARGFWFGVPLALKMNKSFVPVRKPNKLPRPTIVETYDLEYGQDSLEIHQGDIPEGSNVLIVDDLLATAGTITAITNLIKRSGANVVGTAFVVALSDLPGINIIEQNLNLPCLRLIEY